MKVNFDEIPQVLEPLEERIAPAVFVVNSTAGGIDPDPDILTLREAVDLANAAPNRDVIVFSKAVFSSPQTIALDSEIVISEALDIRGRGADLVTLEATGVHRILNITNPGTDFVARISGITLTGGASGAPGGAVSSSESLVLDRVVFVDNVAFGNGGALAVNTTGTFVATGTKFINNGTSVSGGAASIEASSGISIIGSTITGNSATSIGGGLNLSASNPGARILVSDSTFVGNTAGPGVGGALSLSTPGLDGSAAVVRTSFTSNSATISGGAVFLSDGRFSFSGVRMVDNVAEEGGGIFASTIDALTIKRSVFIGNQATVGGGGAIGESGTGTPFVRIETSTFTGNSAASEGGAISLNSDDTRIVRSRFSGNSAGADGGAVSLLNGTVVVSRSVFDSNRSSGEGGAIFVAPASSTFTLASSRILHNSATGDGGGVHLADVGATLIRGSLIFGNSSDASGGGLFRSSSSGDFLLESTRIEANNALGGTGGGAYLSQFGVATFRIDGAIVRGNFSDSHGGGMHLAGPVEKTIVRTTVTDNSSRDEGGGLRVNDGTVFLRSSTVSGNVAASDGGGVSVVGAIFTPSNSRIRSNIAPINPNISGP